MTKDIAYWRDNLSAFIIENKLSLARSQEELVAFLEESNAYAFDFSGDVYVQFLDREHAAPFVKKEFAETWQSIGFEAAVDDFLSYMEFAWGKALNERGLSASRSVQKLGAWLRVFGRDDLYTTINDDDLYNPYGAPALIAVCKTLGIALPDGFQKFAERKC